MTMEGISFSTKNPFKSQTTKMLQRIYQKVSEENGEQPTEGNYFDHLAKYTGLLKEVLVKINNSSLKFDKVSYFIDRSVLYNCYMTYCSKNSLLPTTHELFKSLQSSLPPYLDLPNFRNFLVKMGFTWKLLHEDFNKFVVIEKPEIAFERLGYLKTLGLARKDKIPVYFIMEFAVLENGTFLTVQESLELQKKEKSKQTKHMIVVSGKKVHLYKTINDFTEETFERSLLYDLNIPDPSIIIINNEPHHCKTIYEVPTVNSLKCEMKKWLEFRGIPFEESYTKTELFQLIENSLPLNQGFRITEILKSQHVVLRLPASIKSLSMAELVFRVIKDNYKQVMEDVETATIKVMVETVSPEMCAQFHEHLQNEERRIYNADISFDKMYDTYFNETIRELMKNNIKDEDSDLPLSDIE